MKNWQKALLGLAAAGAVGGIVWLSGGKKAKVAFVNLKWK